MIFTTCAVYGIITACFYETFPTAGEGIEVTYTEIVQTPDDFTKMQMQEEAKQDLNELELLAEEWANNGLYTPYEIPSI